MALYLAPAERAALEAAALARGVSVSQLVGAFALRLRAGRDDGSRPPREQSRRD